MACRQLTEAERKEIFSRFDTGAEALEIAPLGDGLINDTFIVKTAGDAPDYVLQRLNTDIFTEPEVLERNIFAVCDAMRADLEKRGISPVRRYLKFIRTKDGGGMFAEGPECSKWRLSEFITGSKTLKEVTPETAYLAGREFGRFQAVAGAEPMYKGDAKLEVFKEAIPDFHNMAFRMKQLRDAVAADPKGRLAGVRDLVDKIMARGDEMCLAETLFAEGKLPKRICHCDTKVNNMLFDATTGEVLCVIDLDTVMPSFILSDYGDFLRTGAATVPEDHPKFDEVGFDMEIFKSFTKGYLESAGKFLTDAEKELLPYGAALFPFMQCVRFLTDWLNGDTYYKIQYPEHNLVRSYSQWRLFEIADSMRPEMARIVAEMTA